MHTTTDKTLRDDLQASLLARNGVPVGTTWGDFKAAMAALGVKDSDYLASIEHGIAQTSTGYIVRDDVNGMVEIRELIGGRR